MVWRTYSCLNRNCRHEYNAEGDYPPCPRCNGMRVKWVPKPVAIGSQRTAQIDRDAARLATDFGMTNFRTPQRDAPAKAPAAHGRQAGVFEPMKGWKVPLPSSALEGQGHAVCMPTGVTAKLKAGNIIDQKIPANRRLGAGSSIEGSYRPKGGVPQ